MLAYMAIQMKNETEDLSPTAPPRTNSNRVTKNTAVLNPTSVVTVKTVSK